MAPNNQQPGIPRAHLDALAQQQGFPDYNSWTAWNAKRTATLTGNSGGAAPAPTNWLQSIPATPAYIFKYINDRLGKAFGSGQ